MDTLTEILVFPYSAVLAVAWLLAAVAVYRFGGRQRIVRALGSAAMARVLLGIGALLLAVEGTWSVPLHRSWLFVAYALVLQMSLALTVLYGIERRARIGFLLNHLGILLIVWGALFGSPDVSRCHMIVGYSQPTNRAVQSDGRIEQLPFVVELEEFCIDYYPDSISPRQFTSHLRVDGQPMSVAVNSPGSCQGYAIYQQNYDSDYEQYTVLQLVRDPWLPVVYLGMMLLAAGSVMLLFGRWRARLVVPITLLLTVLFTGLTVAKINFGTLMPALRSWWFVPHLFIYMVAYSLMALSLVMWVVGRTQAKPLAGATPTPSGNEGHQVSSWLQVSDNLMRSSSALLIIGMLTGSVWARQAWGDYWAWDPKENWAAVTWLLSLMHLHLAHRRGWRDIALLLLAFLALQITWYGVNYLPSAVDSLHTYMGN